VPGAAPDTLRDGTIVLPVGERPPDLTSHELDDHIRTRVEENPAAAAARV
jgi:hypothetical protein